LTTARAAPADSLDDAVLVARVLTPDALDFVGVNFLNHHVVKNKIPLQSAGNQIFDLIPRQLGRKVALPENG